MSIERENIPQIPKEVPSTEASPVDIGLFEKKIPRQILTAVSRGTASHSAKEVFLAKDILRKLRKMKDLEDYHPSELSARFHVPVQTIYEELEVLRKREESTKPKRTNDQTKAFWEQILKLREKGINDTEIAKRLDLPTGTIASAWTRMKQSGIELPPRKTGRPPKNRRAGPLPIISPEDRLHILKQDLSRREAGDILGILPESVHHYRRLLRHQGVDIPQKKPGAIPSQEIRQKKKEAARMRDEGFENHQIAEALSIEHHRVSSYIYQGRKLP